jgi:hypothetical protein
MFPIMLRALKKETLQSGLYVEGMFESVGASRARKLL